MFQPTKLSDNFYDVEFVSREIFERFGPDSRWFISKEQVSAAEFVRSFFANYFNKPDLKVVINNWHAGGTLNWCGHRTPDCPEGAKLSQHKMKGANDYHIEGVTDYAQIRKIVLANEAEFMAHGITCIEDGTNGWLHGDNRWTGLDHILVVPFQ